MPASMQQWRNSTVRARQATAPLHHRFSFDGCELMFYGERETGVQATDSVARPMITIAGP